MAYEIEKPIGGGSIKTLFFSSKSVFSAFSFLILALSLPVMLFAVQQRQNFNPQAAYDISITPISTPSIIPSIIITPPQNVRVIRVDNQSIDIQWDAAYPEVDSVSVGYSPYYNSQGWVLYKNLSPALQSYRFSNLSSNTAYVLGVQYCKNSYCSVFAITPVVTTFISR